jgi:hypothetical protein
VSERVVEAPPKASRTDPVDVIVPFDVFESNQLHIVVVPPS